MSRMPHTNPVAIARDMGTIAKEADSPTFQKVSKWLLIGSAALTAVVGFIHAARTLYRDLIRPDSSSHRGRDAQPQQQAAPLAAEPLPHASGQERSWVEKARASDRHPHHHQARHIHREEHSVGGRH
jgi:ABC-type nickel/cobalt efflux system permease component RcnA